MKRTLTLLLGFLIWPALVVGIIWITEWLRSTGFSFNMFLRKTSLTVAGYAVGSIVPLIHSNDFYNAKFATISTDQGSFTLEMTTAERNDYDLAKVIVMGCFCLGLIIWIANLTLPDLLKAPPASLEKSLQLVAAVYFVMTGLIQMYIRNSGKPELKATHRNTN